MNLTFTGGNLNILKDSHASDWSYDPAISDIIFMIQTCKAEWKKHHFSAPI
jgi:hypothetical protein